MRRLCLLLLLAGCSKKERYVPPPDPQAPKVVSLAGAYHAVECGKVTAVWSGSDADFPKDGPPTPKAYGVTGLTFRFADGTSVPFTPKGELTFSDWSFDVFAPDCSSVALLEDRFGPYRLVATSGLETMAGATAVEAPKVGETASVHGQWRWTSATQFEFVASCCGGARVFRGGVTSPITLTSIFEASAAPKGVLPTTTGWELAK